MCLVWHQSVWPRPFTGSSGNTDCIRLYSYNNEYQLATCLTNSFIKQKTNLSARCVDPLAKDCWYQVWWRCSIKILVQWKRLAPVSLEESWHPICHRAVLAHLEIHVTGTATVLTKTILAKTQPMPTPYDTLRRFARCTWKAKSLVQCGRTRMAGCCPSVSAS